MRKMITLLLLFMATSLLAQKNATDNKLSITGSVDSYYRTNLTSTDKAIFGGEAQAPSTSFADATGFALGMANAIASYKGVKTGAVADLAFGPRGLAAVGGDNGVFINQLYAYWNISEGTTLTLGRYNTYLGYEVISPVENFNYSTSYLFSNGPFSHVGLKADFIVFEDLNSMFTVMNVTDVNNNLTEEYSLGAQLGYADQFLNFYYDGGAGLGFEVDYTGGVDLSDGFFLGINAAYADNEGNGFYGAALYPQVAISRDFSLGLRGEYFNWKTDDVTDEPKVFATTLTGSYSIENFTIKPELRLDSNSEEVFSNSDLNPTKSLASFIVGAIYSF